MILSTDGIETADLLLALYNNAKCQGEIHKGTPFQKIAGALFRSVALADAKKFLEERAKTPGASYYFGYINLGLEDRPLMVSLLNKEVDFTIYDKHNGVGQALKVITELRNELAKKASSTQGAAPYHDNEGSISISNKTRLTKQ